MAEIYGGGSRVTSCVDDDDRMAGKVVPPSMVKLFIPWSRMLSSYVVTAFIDTVITATGAAQPKLWDITEEEDVDTDNGTPHVDVDTWGYREVNIPRPTDGLDREYGLYYELTTITKDDVFGMLKARFEPAT